MRDGFAARTVREKIVADQIAWACGQTADDQSANPVIVVKRRDGVAGAGDRIKPPYLADRGDGHRCKVALENSGVGVLQRARADDR